MSGLFLLLCDSITEQRRGHRHGVADRRLLTMGFLASRRGSLSLSSGIHFGLNGCEGKE
jgi:hypothetical protein